MQAERRNDLRGGSSDIVYNLPVALAAAAAHHAANTGIAGAAKNAGNIGQEPIILEMAMRIEVRYAGGRFHASSFPDITLYQERV
jgi:hypothetical protein